MSLDHDALEPELERIATDLDGLAQFRDSAQPGWTRTVFSNAYRGSRQWTAELMRSAGMDVHSDPAGNIIGRCPGRNRELPVLMAGSHTDTVHGGGRFDGIVGVLSAIEAVRRLREGGHQLERDLVIVDFLGEEANEFGISCIGSRSIAGLLTVEHLGRADSSGTSLGSALESFGLDPERAIDNAWHQGSVHAYVELHIEQGPVLERSGTSIGVVTAIAGIERLMVSFRGRADHAGTMPMELRQDALVAAARAVLTVEREACGAPVHGVSTTGRIESRPGAFNIVPDEAQIWAEMRSVDREWLQGARRRVAETIAAEAEAQGVVTAIDWLSDQDPVAVDADVADHIAASADGLGLSWEAVPSGAGHDAAHLAHLAPMGMIFVPSVNGRSHVPEELTHLDDLGRGAHVLASVLERLDRTPTISRGVPG